MVLVGAVAAAICEPRRRGCQHISNSDVGRRVRIVSRHLRRDGYSSPRTVWDSRCTLAARCGSRAYMKYLLNVL